MTKPKPNRGVGGRLKAEDSENLNLRILESAYHHFCNEGFANTTIKSIAKGCHTTPRSVLRRYSTKDDLLIAVRTRIGEAITSECTPDKALFDDPVECLREMMSRFFFYGRDLEHPRFIAVCNGEVHRIPQLADDMLRDEEGWEKEAADLIRAAQSKGMFSKYQADTLAASLIAIFLSYPTILRSFGVTKLNDLDKSAAYFDRSWTMIMAMR